MNESLIEDNCKRCINYEICQSSGCNTKIEIEKIRQENQQLKEDYNKVVHESTEFESKVYELQNKIDKAIEVINTQIKLAEGGAKDNLRIIKFYLIKGECSMYDLTTEKDYKY